MTIRTIVTHDDKPDWWTTLLSNPYQLSVGSVFLIKGIFMLLSIYGLVPVSSTTSSKSLDFASTQIVAAWAVSIFFAGAGLTVTTFRRPRSVKGRAAEKAALLLGSVAWGSLGVSVLLVHPERWESWISTSFIALGCALRLVAVSRVERAVLRAIREE